MLWIHGGAFIMGSNSKEMYNPELLLRKDVVVICINYRLGAFGKIFRTKNNKKYPKIAVYNALQLQLIKKSMYPVQR